MKNTTLHPWHLMVAILAGIMNREQQRAIEQARAHAVTIDNIPSLERFQTIPNGKSRERAVDHPISLASAAGPFDMRRAQPKVELVRHFPSFSVGIRNFSTRHPSKASRWLIVGHSEFIQKERKCKIR